GDDRGHGALCHWRLAVRVSVLLLFRQRGHLYVVVWRACRPGARHFPAGLRPALAALCSSAHGFGISWRHDTAAIGAARIPRHELRLRHAIEHAARTGRLWRRARPIPAIASSRAAIKLETLSEAEVAADAGERQIG